MDWETVALVLTALGVGSVIGTLVKAWTDKPINQAQITEIFASTAGKLVEAQNVQINEMQKDFTKYKAETKSENAALICEIGRLEGKIEALEGEAAIKQDEAESMQQEIWKLQRKLDDKDQKIEHLEAENAQLRERVSELERKLEKLVGKEAEK